MARNFHPIEFMLWRMRIEQRRREKKTVNEQMLVWANAIHFGGAFAFQSFFVQPEWN